MMRAAIDQKIVLVTRPTRLATLRQKFNTKQQAKFYIQRAAEIDIAQRAPKAAARTRARAPVEAFADYEHEDETYQSAIDKLRIELTDLLPVHVLQRDFVPSYVFGPRDVVVTLGQDGLVANTAKYAVELSIVAVNPDPQRFDGVLMPFQVAQARSAVMRVLEARAKHRNVTLGEVLLSDGQRLLAFNDFFIGAQTHVSARYRIEYDRKTEQHSSSGVLVSTGAGSTGWLSSMFNMAAGLLGSKTTRPAISWEDPKLMFVVREPFVSKTSSAQIVSGLIQPKTELILTSQMPANGVIFSDGIEADFLQFNSGAVARIRAASQHAKLVTP
jgi:NAD kinase